MPNFPGILHELQRDFMGTPESHVQSKVQMLVQIMVVKRIIAEVNEDQKKLLIQIWKDMVKP